MSILNETHDPALESWIESANDPACDFPIQNLPYGVFCTVDDPRPRIGVAIGDRILDMASLEAAGLLPISSPVFDQPALNDFMALGTNDWSAVRGALSKLLTGVDTRLEKDAGLKAKALVPRVDATMHLPFRVSEYTDFYASKEHATNVGSMFRDPDNALLPNWQYIPIAYNGRASTVVVSGTDVTRPLGQIKPPGGEAPRFKPSTMVDIELEIGTVVGTGNAMGQPVSVGEADAMIFGYVLLNDWSARDIQVWEYQPLGPFQAKAFATTISPWVVTQEALAPFRISGPHQDPRPLPYLRQEGLYNYDISLEVRMQAANRDAATTICETNFKYMYWSSAQQLAHHAACGCAMRPGDLLGSGTISGPTPNSYGSLLELTWNGRRPLELSGGVERTFIKDGDTLTLKGWCQGDGYKVGFGEATGKVIPAPKFSLA